MSLFRTNASICNFGGKLLKLSHSSKVLGCQMELNVYIPPHEEGNKLPVLFYLSGLSCTPNNCTEKGYFQAHAAKYGIAIVYPDTSPRGTDTPGETESWDFGAGAGFYINATKEPWSKHYRMYDYIVDELPSELFTTFPELDENNVSITGHSMGGHGALTLFLRNPGKYKSVSAFAPLCNPSNSPWGTKAFTGYIGEEGKAAGTWAEYDASELVKKYQGPTPEILIDVGTADNAYESKELLPEAFIEAAKVSVFKDKLNLRFHQGYDHSYFFVSTFAEDHVKHAAKYLGVV
jgi:S-formylglutathione hydrolase